MAARAHDSAAFSLRGESANFIFPDFIHSLPCSATSSLIDIQAAAVQAAYYAYKEPVEQEAPELCCNTKNDDNIKGFLDGDLFSQNKPLSINIVVNKTEKDEETPQLCCETHSNDVDCTFLLSESIAENQCQLTRLGESGNQNNETMESWQDWLNLVMNSEDGLMMGTSLLFHTPSTEAEEAYYQFASLLD